MKYLKYLLYFIIALVLIFLAFGLFKPTINYGHEITVNKPIKEAWAVHKDHTKFDQWLKGFKSIEHISGKVGEVGSKYKVIVEPGEGQDDFEMIETIKSRKEFDHITFHFDSDVMTFDQTTYFSEADGKTTIRTESKGTGKGIMMKSMFAMMDVFTGSFKAQEVENIENLKKVIENNTTDYYPEPVPVEEEVLIEEE